VLAAFSGFSAARSAGARRFAFFSALRGVLDFVLDLIFAMVLSSWFGASGAGTASTPPSAQSRRG
jgi:hypothetical protein